jgi:hypothetical protein
LTERIEGQVARVLNAREVAINRGADHGVQEGMRFAILNRQGAGITDPETDEPLGSVEIEKAVVKVVRVHPKLSVARTFRKLRVGGSLNFGMEALFGASRTETETLKSDERTYKEELDESESYVKTGDPVVQVVGEEFQT